MYPQPRHLLPLMARVRTSSLLKRKPTFSPVFSRHLSTVSSVGAMPPMLMAGMGIMPPIMGLPDMTGALTNASPSTISPPHLGHLTIFNLIMVVLRPFNLFGRPHARG